MEQKHDDSIEFRPQHRLFVVLPNRLIADEAAALLEGSGLATDPWYLEGEEGIATLDLTGDSHGLWGRLVRTLQRTMSADSSYLDFITGELRAGQFVLAVHVVDEEVADEVARRLLPFGGYGFAYFAHWAFEPVAA